MRDLAGGGIVEAEEEVDERAFAGAAFAREAEPLPALEREADSFEHRRRRRRKS